MEINATGGQFNDNNKDKFWYCSESFLPYFLYNYSFFYNILNNLPT